MFGFFIAGVSLLGLIAISTRRHRRSPVSWALRRLDASPAQEKVIREATNDIRGAFRELRSEGRDAKGELAELLQDESFDQAKAQGWIANRKLALDRLSPRLLTAAEEIHTTLDAEQREKLSRWVTREGFHHRRSHC